ncbi:hypothetical protein vseg_002668 [Gypsophila vaccaria]
MATTIRGSLGGREKRGTSPSSSLTKKSLKPSSQPLGSSSSSSGTTQKRSTPSDGKSVPNYLKPTRSANLDISANKRSGTDSTQKPMINRRRSFDRPPPTSQVQKAIRNVPGTREVKPVRSASFSHKIGTSSLAPSSTRPASDRTYARTTSSLKESRIEPVVAKSRSIKKGTLSSSVTPGTRKDKIGLKSALYAKKAPKSVTSESSNDHDIQSIDHLVDDDDLVNMDIEVQSLPEMSEMPDTDQELGDPTIILSDVEGKSPVADVQSNFAVSDEQNVDDQVAEDTVTNVDHEQENTEEQTVENQAEMPNVEHSDEDQNITNEDQNVTDEEQNATIDDHQNVTVEEHANPTAEEEKLNVTSEEQNETAEEQNVTAESSDAAADREEQNVKLPEEKKETAAEPQKEAEKKGEEKQGKFENATVTRPAQTSAGKKDKQDYNDVIEETATKLMGGKKNKVLALAGAFETVISLQDTSKN